MPSVSLSQQRLMGQAYALKTGKIKLKDIDPDYRDKISKLADGMSKGDLKDFASNIKESVDINEEVEVKYITSFDKFVYESKMLQYTKNELELAGMFNEDDETGPYNKLIAKAVVELMTTFSNQGHSGFSASMVRDIFNKLSNWETLTPITSNPDEWSNVAETTGPEDIGLWQNKRNPAIFSKDAGKTWYNVDESILGYIEACLENIMLNPGMNVTRMGPVKFPGNAGTTTAFHGQNIGSGDVPMFVIDPGETKNDEEEVKKKLKKKKKGEKV